MPQVKRGEGHNPDRSSCLIHHTHPVHVAKRENPIVNRLNKTKVERAVDHEQERIDRVKAESAIRRGQAAEKVFS